MKAIQIGKEWAAEKRRRQRYVCQCEILVLWTKRTHVSPSYSQQICSIDGFVDTYIFIGIT
jgi:hypothetical protein